MKEDRDARIAAMREGGMSIRAIADELGISAGSVRNSLSSAEGRCAFCGKKLNFVPGKKRKRFCDDRCRTGYWNAEKRRKMG